MRTIGWNHERIVDAIGVLGRDSSFSTVLKSLGSEAQLSSTSFGISARRWLCEQTKSLDGAEQGQRTSTSEEVLSLRCVPKSHRYADRVFHTCARGRELPLRKRPDSAMTVAIEVVVSLRSISICSLAPRRWNTRGLMRHQSKETTSWKSIHRPCIFAHRRFSFGRVSTRHNSWKANLKGFGSVGYWRGWTQGIRNFTSCFRIWAKQYQQLHKPNSDEKLTLFTIDRINDAGREYFVRESLNAKLFRLKRRHALSGWRALSQHGAFPGAAGGGSLRTSAQQQAKSDLNDGRIGNWWMHHPTGNKWMARMKEKSGKMKVFANWQRKVRAERAARRLE